MRSCNDLQFSLLCRWFAVLDWISCRLRIRLCKSSKLTSEARFASRLRPTRATCHMLFW